jgi:hypothetical protein
VKRPLLVIQNPQVPPRALVKQGSASFLPPFANFGLDMTSTNQSSFLGRPPFIRMMRQALIRTFLRAFASCIPSVSFSSSAQTGSKIDAAMGRECTGGQVNGSVMQSLRNPTM